MIKTTHTPLNPAATLRHTRDTRFKTARLSLVWVFPADAEASPLTTLLFGIYRRGSKHYPRRKRQYYIAKFMRDVFKYKADKRAEYGCSANA